MFKAHDVAPITWLQDGVGIYELSNGPSLSINDFSLQFLSQVHEKHWAKGPRSITLLGATTGDMGASAEAAFGGHSDVNVENVFSFIPIKIKTFSTLRLTALSMIVRL